MAAVVSPRIFAIRSKSPRALRVLGTHVTLRPEIRERAERELGFPIEFEPGGSSFVLQKASTRPQSFDVYEQWSDSVRLLWGAGAIKPIEAARIARWKHINPLTKTGKLTPDAKEGAGDAPVRILNVQSDGALGRGFTGKLSFLPYVHNVDSFGYDTRTVPLGKPYVTESWGSLLDPQWAGKVGIVNAPTIGLFDLALAATAKGLIEIEDIGAMTPKEVHSLMDLAVEYRQAGHFCGLWNSVPESESFVRRGRMLIGSMFSPAAAGLNASGIPVQYAAPKEGYRAWHGVQCLSSAVDPEVEEMAYQYMNWWLSGWPGAHIARIGYYISNPADSREHLTTDEWNYYYAGLPTVADILNSDGQVAVPANSIRNGGSYEQRLSRVAVWNTVMHSYEHSLVRWREFLSA